MADGARSCVTHLGVSPDLQARTGCGATRLLTVFEPSACKEGAALRQAPSPRDQLKPTTQYDPLSGHSCCCSLVRRDKIVSRPLPLPRRVGSMVRPVRAVLRWPEMRHGVVANERGKIMRK